MALKRLMKEWREVSSPSHESAGVRLKPVDEVSLMQWRAEVDGPTDTPYEGGVFVLDIRVTPRYPLEPPKITFVTKVCHPNVHIRTGAICLDLLQDAWSPAYTLHSTCLAVGQLLLSPEPSSPLNCDAANLLRCGDTVGFNSLVRMYTQLYAMAPRTGS